LEQRSQGVCLMDDMKTLLEVLSEINDEIDFETETGLIDQGWIDSLDLMRIIAALNVAFDIRITTGDIEPENFNSAEAMLALVRQHREEA